MSIRSSAMDSEQRGQKVHVIDDTDSDENSILNVSQNEMININDDIEAAEMNELIRKRETNVYDLLNLYDPGHKYYDKIKIIMQDQNKEMAKSRGLGSIAEAFVELKDAAPKSFYSENIKFYSNKMLMEIIMVLYKGFIHLIQIDEKSQLATPYMQPINFLDDITKVIYSEKHTTYLALKLRDMRKTQGDRDHLVIELKDRELFADFVMDYAAIEEDEIIFEHNEDFSMLVNSSPVWFSFEDIERLKK